MHYLRPGDTVRIKGDQDTYTVYALYPDGYVSLGLLDYPDTEQDELIHVSELNYTNTL